MCYLFIQGRNDYAINIITKELRYLTWEETFLALRSDILPDAIRAKYCDMTTSKSNNISSAKTKIIEIASIADPDEAAPSELPLLYIHRYPLVFELLI